MTGHLIGLLYRALLCREIGMQAVWVFDGRPPRQKLDELSRRRELKEEAIEKAERAREEGDGAEVAKQAQRSLFVRKTERDHAKELIRLMGNFEGRQGFRWWRARVRLKPSVLG